jgi:hypothetical protein
MRVQLIRSVSELHVGDVIATQVVGRRIPFPIESVIETRGKLKDLFDTYSAFMTSPHLVGRVDAVRGSFVTMTLITGGEMLRDAEKNKELLSGITLTFNEADIDIRRLSDAERLLLLC